MARPRACQAARRALQPQHDRDTPAPGVNSLVFSDPDLARRTIDRVVAKADLIYHGHDLPFRLTAIARSSTSRRST